MLPVGTLRVPRADGGDIIATTPSEFPRAAGPSTPTEDRFTGASIPQNNAAGRINVLYAHLALTGRPTTFVLTYFYELITLLSFQPPLICPGDDNKKMYIRAEMVERETHRRPPPPPPDDQDFWMQPPHYGTPLMDTTGKIYVILTVVWSVLIGGGTLVFLRHRNLPFIRLKNVRLVIAALALLHLQLVFDALQYPLNGALPCVFEFWIMNICLP
jgi:hypothetical protein